MGIGFRHVVWTSAALALGAFIYVVTLEPMDEGAHPRAEAFRRGPSTQTYVNRIRSSMANRQLEAAQVEARELFSQDPEEIVALFYNALVERALGNDEHAQSYWQMVINLAESDDDGSIGMMPNLYYYAWAQLEAGDEETGRQLFGQLSDQYEADSRDGDDRWGGLGAIDHYNLACYRSLAGELELAMAHWDMAVELGYGDMDSRWWMADPDLEPLHADEAFWAIGARISSPKQLEELAPDAADRHAGMGDSEPGAAEALISEPEYEAEPAQVPDPGIASGG
ncbi:MAG: TPR end-of-group domain-containing protein [Phycisphaerales bacterium]